MEYKKFLDALEKEILGKDFLKSLDDVKKIDNKHFKKEISKDEIKAVIDEYKKLDEVQNEKTKIQFVTYGNPEVVLRLCIESIRNSVSSIIVIEDFCLAQNTLLVSLCSNILKNMKSKLKIELKNLLSVKEIAKFGAKADKTICVGNSNEYNALVDEIDNLEFYPYNVFILYSDSDEFDELKRKTYDYAGLNGYQMEIIDDDTNFDDALDIMNEDSYNFASVLFSKNKGRIKLFKDVIKSEYKIVNENPFYKTKFKLEI